MGKEGKHRPPMRVATVAVWVATLLMLTVSTPSFLRVFSSLVAPDPPPPPSPRLPPPFARPPSSLPPHGGRA